MEKTTCRSTGPPGASPGTGSDGSAASVVSWPSVGRGARVTSVGRLSSRKRTNTGWGGKPPPSRLADQPLVRPLGVLHLADDLRPHPGRPLVFRHGPFAGRRLPLEPFQLGPGLGEPLASEAAPGTTRIH